MLTTREAARIIGCHQNAIYYMIYSGRISGEIVNGRWRLDAESVEAYQTAYPDRMTPAEAGRLAAKPTHPWKNIKRRPGANLPMTAGQWEAVIDKARQNMKAGIRPKEVPVVKVWETAVLRDHA